MKKKVTFLTWLSECDFLFVDVFYCWQMRAKRRRCGMYSGFSAQLNVKDGDEGATLCEVGWLKVFFLFNEA